MTMVLALLTQGHALQVSDRLVTTQTRAGGVREFDALANKTVIFRARDAAVAIGYSGRAYLDGLPTDVWIAQSLSAMKFSPGFGMGVLDVGPTHWPSIAPALTRLRVDADAAIARLTAQERHSYLQQFHIVGVRIGKRTRRLSPLFCTIEEPLYGCPLKLAYEDAQRWSWERGYLIATTPDMEPGELAYLASQLKQHAEMGLERCEAILAASIRRVADKDPTVGKNLMSVRIGPGIPQVLIRYLPFSSESSPSNEGLPLAYTPWVIAPPAIHAPALSNTGWETQHLSWSVVGLPEQKGPRRLTQTSQPRPRHR